MRSVLRLSVLALMCVIHCSLAYGGGLEGDDDVQRMAEMQQAANFHLKELQKNLFRMTSLQQRSLRAKRDEGRADHFRKIDVLFNSLLDFCGKIQHLNGDGQSTTEGELELPKEPEKESWLRPDIYPTRLQARAKSPDVVNLQFDYVAKVPGQLTRTAGLDIKIYDLPRDLNSQGHQGRIDFDIDTSAYCQGGYKIDNHFIFQSNRKRDEKSLVTLMADICGFDQFQNESLLYGDRKRKMRQSPAVEEIHLPKFKVESNITDRIVVTPGRNASFEMTMLVGENSYAQFYVVLHDRQAKKMIDDNFYYDVNQRDYQAEPEGKRRLVMVETLKVSAIEPEVKKETLVASEEEDEDDEGKEEEEEDDDDKGGEREKMMRVRLRVTLVTDSKHVTGKLYISASKRKDDYYSDPVNVYLVYTHVIRIQRGTKKNVFPRRRVLIHNYGPIICGPEGNEGFQKFGRNCTVWCAAIGREMPQLTITTTADTKAAPIYRSVSYRMADRMYTLIDVGPASAVNGGNYSCSAIGSKGLIRTQVLELVTYDTPKFPDFDANETRLEMLDNQTARLTCKVTGRLPMDLTVELDLPGGGVQRDDNATFPIRRQIERPEDMTLTFEFPTYELRHEQYCLVLVINNGRGEDSHLIFPEDVIPAYDASRDLLS